MIKSKLQILIERRQAWVEFRGAKWCSQETRENIIREIGFLICKEFSR